jgi:predicted RNA-binding Zn-ribbon protein involved in translation (DUF1610 family)
MTPEEYKRRMLIDIMQYIKKSDNVYTPIKIKHMYNISEELVNIIFNDSKMASWEAVDWLQNLSNCISERRDAFSQVLNQEIYDQALKQFICPRCGAELENLPYMARQQQGGYNYECPECGEQY